MKCSPMALKLCGVVNVGPKGQVVIPKEIRDTLGIQVGDQFAVVLKDNKYIGLVDNKDMGELMLYLKNEKD